MFNIGGGEILVILIVALVILGPDKLPQAMRQAGKVMGEVRKVSDGFRREVKEAMADDAGEEAQARERGRQLAAPPTDAVPLDALPGAERPTGNGARGNGSAGNGSDAGTGSGPAPAEPDDRHDG